MLCANEPTPSTMNAAGRRRPGGFRVDLAGVCIRIANHEIHEPREKPMCFRDLAGTFHASWEASTPKSGAHGDHDPS